MKPLAFSNPVQISDPPVQVGFTLENGVLRAQFAVETKHIHAKRELTRFEYPYEFDVVELFVTADANSRPCYYEFEVSPYNQGLQVNVFEPRQEFHLGVKNGFEHTATITENGWEAEIKIPLSTLGKDLGKTPRLTGNAFAALGEKDARVYWSLFKLPSGRPDFHVPSAFRPLFE